MLPNPESLFPFPLDEFQKQAIAALNSGKSVVVCVPTGSGKTLVGEYAIHRAMAKGKRVLYTTPLKALSNQKFRDFRQQFGPDKVGLLTGDASVNRDGAVLVMTTEIFRNMLYGTPIGQVGTSLEDVETVVLDECHYMNDSQRGTVWEESIVYCPNQIQLVALSATIANPEQLTDWITRVHGATELIYSDFRPVPLEFYFSTPKGLFPLLNEQKNQIHHRLKVRKQNPKQRVKREDCPAIAVVVSQLQEKDMLPAIYFIFSRKGCDQAINELGNLNLVNPQEAQELHQRIEEFIAWNPDASRGAQLEPLHRGIASHHAGILPLWKSFVEELFQDGLIKVVFATETLAAGINMPARTTVISSISKRTDSGHRLLKASEFLQMSGRAGRRGMDEVGYVVTVQTPFEGAKDAANLALKPPDPLSSQFTPTYGMVLNLLQTHNIEQVQELLERSFGRYVSLLKIEPEQVAIVQLTTELAKLDIELAQINDKQFSHYQKLTERLKEERRLLKILLEQAQVEHQKEIVAQASTLEEGQVLYLKGKNVPFVNPTAAVLGAKIVGQGHGFAFLCLAANNYWYLVSPKDIFALGDSIIDHSLMKMVSLPEPPPSKVGESVPGDPLAASLASFLGSELKRPPEFPEVLEQRQRIEIIQAEMANHPLLQWGKPGQLIKRHKHRLSLREELNGRQTKYKEYQATHWREFLSLIKVLREFEALDDFTPTPLGQAAAAIRGDNELWLGLALMSGELDYLEANQLAAAVCTLISEPPRPDSWTDYEPSESTILALEALLPIRKRLIKCQYRHKVPLPVWLESETVNLVGLVEQWVLGVEWGELCDRTSFDEGDLVRMLRRTMDFLSQVPHVPGISKMLQDNARRTLSLMERFPVQEIVF